MRLLILTKRSLISIGFCLLIGAATAAIAIVPVVVIFLVFQKQFMKGLTEGAVKG